MDRITTKIELLNKEVLSVCFLGKEVTKLSVAILLVSVCSFTSLAQVSFGVKGGMNLNYMLFNYELNGSILNEPDPISNVGFHLGGYMQVPLSKKFSFQPELQFSRRGTGDFNLNYLELPLLVSFIPIKVIQLEFGANAAFLVSSSKAFFSDGRKAFDAGITGGVRYSLSKRIFISGRYYFGLFPAHSVDLNKLYGSINPDDPFISSGSRILDTYNRNIQFSLGYKIK